MANSHAECMTEQVSQRTFALSQSAQDSVDEEDPVRGLAIALGLLDEAAGVRVRVQCAEDAVEFGDVKHIGDETDSQRAEDQVGECRGSSTRPEQNKGMEVGAAVTRPVLMYARLLGGGIQPKEGDRGACSVCTVIVRAPARAFVSPLGSRGFLGWPLAW